MMSKVMMTLLERAEKVEEKKLPLDDKARSVRMADGDARAVLTLAEEVWRSKSG